MTVNYYQALSHVDTYVKFRPCPPASLYTAIVNFLQGESPSSPDLAVDIGCGSGQSTRQLSPYFKRVIGFDPSEEVINSALKDNPCHNVSFRVSGAEEIALDKNSVDLVTVCQAIHWFDLKKFYAEVNRIIRDDGVLAVYGYNLPELRTTKAKNEKLAGIVRKYYEEVLGEYVNPASRECYLNSYSKPEFNEVPFVVNGKMKRETGYVTQQEVTLEEVMGYMKSWSTYQTYIKSAGQEAGETILSQFKSEVEELLEKEDCKDLIASYNYFLLLGRKQGSSQ